MAQAMKELLVEKGVLTADEIRATIERIDGIEPSLGGRIIARAWCDADFKARLLANGTEAVKEFDVDMGDAELIVVENTPARHNLKTGNQIPVSFLQEIDTKVDDGLPNAGFFRFSAFAAGDASPVAGAAAAPNCTNGGGQNAVWNATNGTTNCGAASLF
jgi:hypothetical protein